MANPVGSIPYLSGEGFANYYPNDSPPPGMAEGRVPNHKKKENAIKSRVGAKCSPIDISHACL
jgi:hypothetical protein